MWQKISFFPVVQQGVWRPWQPPCGSVKNRPKAHIKGWVGFLGEEAGYADGWVWGSWGLRYNSRSSKSGLTHLQTEVSETFHCGPLRLFLLGAVLPGKVFVFNSQHSLVNVIFRYIEANYSQKSWYLRFLGVMSVHLKISYVHKSPGNFVNIRILIQGVWGGALCPTFLGNSQMLLMLLVHGPHIE